MSTYIEKKVMEALKGAGGNHMRAAMLLQEMAEKDEVLYAGLTNPFLASAATFAVQRHLSQRRQGSTSAKKAGRISDGDLDQLVGRMANNPSQNDFVPTGHPDAHGKAPAGSTRHASNMQRIAEAFGVRRTTPTKTKTTKKT